jgi:hypothetical protein
MQRRSFVKLLATAAGIVAGLSSITRGNPAPIGRIGHEASKAPDWYPALKEAQMAADSLRCSVLDLNRMSAAFPVRVHILADRRGHDDRFVVDRETRTQIARRIGRRNV